MESKVGYEGLGHMAYAAGRSVLSGHISRSSRLWCESAMYVYMYMSSILGRVNNFARA